MHQRLLLFLLVILGKRCVHCFIPSFLWPLCEYSGAREALADEQINHPDNDLYVGPGIPFLDYRALSLAGNDKLIQVNMPNDLNMGDFFFAFYFYPMESTGPVLSYTSSPTQGFLSEILIQITEGVVQVKIIEYPDTVVYSSSDLTANINQWNYFAIERRNNDGNIRIFNNTFILTKTAVTMDTLGPGEMKFGSNDTTFLSARFACAALYANLFLDAPADYEVYTECLTYKSWPFYGSYSPKVVDEFPFSTTSSATQNTQESVANTPLFSVSKAWPMNNISFGFSYDGDLPLFPQNSECFRLSEDSPNLYFDGSGQSYLEQTIAADVFRLNFTIGMMLKPGDYTKGTVFHYVYSGVWQIVEIELLIDDNDLMLIFLDPTQICGYLKVINVVAPNSWNYIRVHFQRDAMHLYINGDWLANSTQCTPVSGSTSALGRLRIGASMNGGNNFRGSINCFVVFNGMFTDGKDDFLSICEGSSTPIGIDRENCDKQPDAREGHFVLKATDRVPSVGVPAVLEVELSSKLHCGKLCLETRNCRSFVVEGGHAGGLCHLYDFQADNVGLVYTSSAKYFVIHYMNEE